MKQEEEEQEEHSSVNTIVEKLQNSLRLVHCLQKERGASASYYAYCVSYSCARTRTTRTATYRTLCLHGQRRNSGIGASLETTNVSTCTSSSSKLLGTKDHNNNNNISSSSVDQQHNGKNQQHIGNLLKESLVQSRCDTDLAFDWLDNVKGWKLSLDRVRNKIDEGCRYLNTNNTNNVNKDQELGGVTKATTSTGNIVGGITSGDGTYVKSKNVTSVTSMCSDGVSGDDNDDTHDHPPQRQLLLFGSHRVVVMYNILIGNIVDECVLRLIHAELKSLRESLGHDIRSRTNENCDLETKHGMSQKELGRSSNAGDMEPSHNQREEIMRRSTMSHVMARSLPLDINHDFHCMNPSYALQGSKGKGLLVPQSFQNHWEDKKLQGTLEHDHQWCNHDGDYRNHDTNDEEQEHSFQLPSHAASANRLTHSHRHSRTRSDFDVDQHHGLHHPFSSLASCSADNIDSATRAKTNNSNCQIGQERQWEGHEEDLVGLSSSSVPKSSRNICLLLLLLSLVNLKESTGTERAILSSLIALSPQGDNDTHDSKSKSDSSLSLHASSTLKLFNDLVVEEANQQRIARELQQLANKNGIDSSLYHMVQKMLSPSPEMTHVQDMIQDFNLQGLQHVMPLQDFWKMITLYIDQLHALELLLLDEIRLNGSEHVRKDKGGEVDGAVHSKTINSETHGQQTLAKDMVCSMNPGWKALTKAELLEEIKNTPPDDIKQMLLNHVRMWNSSSAGTTNSNSDSAVSSRRPSNTEKDFLAEPVSTQGCPNSILNRSESDHMWKEWEIGLYEIEFCQRIGRGVGGITYLAKWSGQQVAVKVSANTDLALDGWHTEVNSLRRLHHPNVIRLLGSIYNPSPQTYGLVLEYCNSGDMANALLQPTPPIFFWKIAQDVANGMSYLHRKHILHRDIKPANVLLDGNVTGGTFTAKLTDFGVAIMHQSAAGEEEEHTAETGTYRWMSPEVIRHEAYSFMADVYSYAILLWQLVTHEIPFQTMSQLEAAGKVAIEDARPPFPSDTPKMIEALIQRCWNRNPNDRLLFPRIIEELDDIYHTLSNKEQKWLQNPTGHRVYDDLNDTTAAQQQCPSYSNNIVVESKPSTLVTNSKAQVQQQQQQQKQPNRGGLFSFFHKKKQTGLSLSSGWA